VVASNNRELSEGGKPQEGRQPRERQAEVARCNTLERSRLPYACVRHCESHEGRFGEGRTQPGERENPGGDEVPGRLRACVGSKPPGWVTDFRVEQNPGVEGCSAGLTPCALVGWRPLRWCDSRLNRSEVAAGGPTARGERRRERRTAAREEQSLVGRTPGADPV